MSIELDELLAKAGLKKEYMCIQPNFHFWDEAEYKQYVTAGYRNSSFAETDSAYSMYEGNLVNLQTGLRITYLGTEGYFGDYMSYKIIAAFVLTKEKELFYIDDIDPENKFFTAGNNKITFEETLKS